MKKIFLVAALLLGLAGTSNALNSPVLPGAYQIFLGDWSSGATEPGGAEWYKANVENGGVDEEGSGASLFTTVFGEDPDDPKHFAQIFWDSSSLTPSLTAVYIKLGAGTWSFDLTGVDLSGYDSILAWSPLSPTATRNGISHIRILGEPGTRVPDSGTTVMLLGAGLSMLGLIRRKFSL